LFPGGCWVGLECGNDKPRGASETAPVANSELQWLGAPRRSRATAIAWKQLRESAPLALVGGLAVFIASPAIAGMTSSIARADYFEMWQMTAITTWLIAGVFVAVVAGIGSFYEDLRPGLHTFWRSRPIDVDAWFWIKLFTSLTITVGAFATGPLMTLAALSLTGHAAIVDIPDEPHMAEIYGGGLLLHSATFVLAALAIVLVRQPVMAAMLTFGVWIAIAISIGTWLDDAPQLPLQALVALGIAGLGGFAILAWQALRRDWGWKGAD
jgi:hypothetical protein